MGLARSRLITDGVGGKKWQNVDYVVSERPILVGNMDHQQAIREKAQWLLYSAAH